MEQSNHKDSEIASFRFAPAMTIGHFYYLDYSNGAKSLVNGAKRLVDGDKILVNGDKILVNGDKILVDGAKILVNGDKILVNGAKRLVNGDKILVNGAKRLVDGDKILINLSQLAPYPAQHSKYWANSLSPFKWTAINLKKLLKPIHKNPDTYKYFVGARHCRALTNVFVSLLK
ncbi:hypothetical protein [Nostoc sp.]|uniref:hypothetical protein n=1 Tax=Nostoc sp. TaxID=1180 RepID=UPI002FF5247B